MKKLAIIGCSPNRIHAPFYDDSWDKIGVNNLYISYPDVKWAYWSEIHYIDQDEKGVFRRRFQKEFRGLSIKDYLKGLNNLNVPVLMQKEWPEIVPNATPYPLLDVLKLKHPVTGQKLCPEKYFTNSISYMIAWGILQGYETIGIWGVDMAVASEIQNTNEYSWQRPSCEFWIGVCRGLGIDCFVTPTADLLKTRFLYGFQERTKTAWENKTREIKIGLMQKLEETKRNIEILSKKKEQLEGGISVLRDEQRIWE